VRTRLGRVDLVAAGCVGAVVGLWSWDLLRDGTAVGMDTATAFYPWYAYLGENLRSGHVPVWNPHQFSGTPFAGDPESGWTYAPAMLLFTLLPLTAAGDAFLVVHLLLAGLATYALARSLGSGPLGALLAAMAYVLSGFFFGHNVCCFAYSGVAAWLPAALLGAERALQSTERRQWLTWCALGGLAISQILAAWLGQGAYYALLFTGAYVAYRGLLTSGLGLRRGFTVVVLRGGALLVFGFGIGAVGLLPRVEYNAFSNLPGGYGAAGIASPSAGLTDWGVIEDWAPRLLSPGFHYAGRAALALALAAPLLVRDRYAVPFFAVISGLVLVLARWQPTPLHVALAILPGFGPMHMHAPERALVVFFLGPALLAGATVDYVHRLGRHGAVAASLLALVVIVDLRSAWQIQLADGLAASGAYELHRVDLDAYYAPTGAARFLQSATAEDRSRAIGYAQHVSGGPLPYTLRWADPQTAALGVNNRALLSGLDDVQGYNPLHLARYDAFMAVLNGHPQEYHQTDVLESGLSSPLLDMLAVRYIVLPASPRADQVEPRLTRDLPVVYADADVVVLENATALPRAWLVHAAVQTPVGEALSLLGAGAIDPRRIALLERPPPPMLIDPASSVGDRVRITEYAADRVRLEVEASSPALLVLSDAYYPAWQARVDGASAEVYAADVALRAVGVPAGRHTVEFEYASAALPLGAAITALTVLAMAAAIGWSRRAR
jgi:Bacterial membrane protein YfhO